MLWSLCPHLRVSPGCSCRSPGMGAAASHMAVPAGSCQEAIIHPAALPTASPSPFMALSAAPNHPAPSQLHFTFHLNFLRCHLSSLQLFCLVKFMREINPGPFLQPQSLFYDEPSQFHGTVPLHNQVDYTGQIFCWLFEELRVRQKFCEWFGVKHLICIIITFIFSSEDNLF